jgi:hypothetical protein
VVVLGCVTAYEGLFETSASTDTRRWAQTILSSIVTGAISFVIGRRLGK